MAETTQPSGAALLIRYILIGLAFVLIFVGTAYLVFRLTRRAAVSTRPTSATTFQPGQSSVAGPMVNYPILPAPQLPARQLQRQLPTNPLTNPPLTTKIGNILIAQDGHGNLLFDNLTHEEKFQLERDRIQAASQLALAKEQTRAIVEKQKLESRFRSTYFSSTR